MSTKTTEGIKPVHNPNMDQPAVNPFQDLNAIKDKITSLQDDVERTYNSKPKCSNFNI